jgi:hypothetical protein
VTGSVDRALAAADLPAIERRDAPASAIRFPDGVAFRIEIPSTEGPEALEAVLDEADRLDVPVRRVSQGSGVGMLTDAELDRMATIAADAGIEVSLFARPGAGWGPSASARAPAGQALASASWGHDQLRAGIDDVLRAAEHGFRSVLIADIGLLSVFARLKAAGQLPAEMQAKVSVMLPAANAAAARVLEELGAGTLNVPGDLDVAQLATIRSVVTLPLDIYVESPDDLGGFVRLHEAAELIRVTAPIHLKLGLRNAPALYPSGAHLSAVAIATVRERVRRARLVMEGLERAGVDTTTSAPGAAGLALPVVG